MTIQSAISNVLNANTRESITQAAHGFAAKDVVYNNAGTWTKAQASTLATANKANGVVESATTDTFVVVYSGKITGLSGLTAGSVYFLSSGTAGLLTTTPPTYAKAMLYATSTTDGFVLNSHSNLKYRHTQGSLSMTWTIVHNLGTSDVIFSAYDGSNVLLTPSTATLTDANTVTLTFGSPGQSGFAIVMA